VRPPKKIRVGHMTLAVDYNDDECDALGSDGHTLIGARRIALRSYMSPDREREVMLHESLHTVVELTGMPFKDEDEERLVSALTGPLLDLLRRNPKLVAFLTRED